MKTVKILAGLSLLVLSLSCSGQSETVPVTGLSHSSPASQGMREKHLELIDSVVADAISRKEIPGAVVSVVRNGEIVYLKAYGNKSLVPEVVPMTEETMFDMASVSKCVGTTLSFMQLIEQGKVRLSDPVSRYIPGFLPWVDPKDFRPQDIQDVLTIYVMA